MDTTENWKPLFYSSVLLLHNYVFISGSFCPFLLTFSVMSCVLSYTLLHTHIPAVIVLVMREEENPRVGDVT